MKIEIRNTELLVAGLKIADIESDGGIKWAYKGAEILGGKRGSIPLWLREEIDYALKNSLSTVPSTYGERRLDGGILRGSRADLELQEQLAEQKRLAAIYSGINEGGDGYNPYRIDG